MTSPSYFVPPSPPPRAPRRHVVLAAFALAILSILVVGPVALVLLLVGASLLTFVGAGALTWVGAAQEGVLKDASVVTAILLGSTILLAVASKLDAYFRRPPPGVPGAATRPTRLPWVARHSWLSAAAFAFVIDACLIPLDGGHVVELPSTMLAVGVFTGGALIMMLAAYTIQTAWWRAVRALFSGARRSSFFAGAVTAGCLLTTLIALLVGSALTRTASALGSVAAPSSIAVCNGESVLGCSRKVLDGTYGEAGARDLAPIGVSGSPEAPSSFAGCIEELHRAPPGRRSARDDGLEQARRFTDDWAEAEDVVQATMIAVCSGSERITEIRPYFIRSIQNHAMRFSLRRHRTAPAQVQRWPSPRSSHARRRRPRRRSRS